MGRTRRLTWRLFSAAMLSILTVALIAPQASATGNRSRKPFVPGMVIVESERSVDETWDTLVGALESNPNIRLIATIDHAAAAASAGLELDDNRVAVFGNPALGSPLMVENQVTGLDLPQKIQVFESRDRVWVGFNDATYLEARHHLGDQPTLDTIAGALRALSGAAIGEEVDARSFGTRRFERRPKLLTVASDAGVEATWERLLAAIDGSPANVAFTVDHQAGAASVGIELRPTRLVVFGNPALGTPLMQRRPTSGIDLPLKILVWEDDHGQTFVSTNDPSLLRRRHRVRRGDLVPIETAIENFVAAATTTPVGTPSG